MPITLGALAGALGWGIRGQYGHETGAMIAGALVSLAFILVFCRHWQGLDAARAAAFMTIAVGIGGSMTYGQTIGLTQDAPLIGNTAALTWGMLGLALKGGIWIAFGGLFLGAGLGGNRYRPLEFALLAAACLGAFFAGCALLNAPFDPAQRRLPFLYFSDNWRWEPGAELKPRREVWGGLLLALAIATAYLGWIRRDRLAPRLAGWGFLAGAIGFPAGQALQAAHAWKADWLQHATLQAWDPYLNWWNLMETTFGLVWGAILGLGLWLNRARIRPPDLPILPLPRRTEAALLTTHLVLLMVAEFSDLPLGIYTDLSLLMVVLPLAGTAGGRAWPFLVPLVITVLPIATKTVRHLANQETGLASALGWLGPGLVFGLAPVALGIAITARCVRHYPWPWNARTYARTALLALTWTFLALNFAVFRFPWPWAEWTVRTPNALIFLACAFGITAIALAPSTRRGPPATSVIGG